MRTCFIVDNEVNVFEICMEQFRCMSWCKERERGRERQKLEIQVEDERGA